MNLTNLLQHWHGIIFILLCGLTLVQVFYYLFFFTRLAFFRSTVKTNLHAYPVSVIICARDEAANLAENLPASLTQAYSASHEIIVVNDNSIDNSKYVLDSFVSRFSQLNVIELKQEAKLPRGKKYPLSAGIKTAKHEIVLLTDADCIPASERWIDKMQQTYDDDTEVVLGYGAYHKKKGVLNKLVRWETFHTALQYLSYALAGIPYMGVGRNLSYKKAVFLRHGGFSAHSQVASGDDDLFINMAATKRNTRINIDGEAFTLSEPPSTWSQWKRQKRRHYSTAKYYRPLHKFLLGSYSLSHFLFYPLVTIVFIFFSWKYALLVFACRFAIQALVLFPAMKKLGEKDLYWMFLLFDIWMFIYYFIFANTLIKKPGKAWK